MSERQADLFAVREAPERPAYQAHSETSKQAADAIAPTAGTLRAMVLDYITGTGQDGATDEEIQTALAMNPSTQRPRRIELLAQGHICDSGTKRNTLSGRKATVWKTK